ncbi:hypothetical protein D8674_015600 [Pyrus ussuriensis x Pyrus communis]|uniref:Uncharacterized protein n=1 Tax=Pyrus ussuriensis x Pyrus communis TaxID=2448454 RepID=A0A5N5HEP2_9ROSA|nr:hypothetical protein D8674_015600 [Pyrus ussuriensis x Pyrus communis]
MVRIAFCCDNLYGVEPHYLVLKMLFLSSSSLLIWCNRTAHKASSLYDNQGLACIALQYIKAYQGDCDAVGGPDAKKPPDSAFAETFAPNRGVQTSTLAPITGRLIGCQSKYNHTEVGAAASGSDGGAPYFWCVLFSSGKTYSTFVTEGGEAKITRPRCFSGANDDCSESNHPTSGADDWSRSSRLWPIFTTALTAMSCAFGL